MANLFRLLALATAFGSLLAGQDIAGTWQGTLTLGQELRLMFKVSKGEGGAMKATLYSLDQGGVALPSSSVTASGGAVKMAFPSIAASYEGKLTPEGKSMTGTWNQGSLHAPLALKSVSGDDVWTIPPPTAAMKPMPADADPVFEVATIKPSRPEAQGKAITIRGTRFITINTSVSDLVTFAYNLHARQVTGGPAWLETEKYDISAQPDLTGLPNEKQLKSMVRKLLVERWQLSFHREQKQLSVYAITVAKNGVKMTKSEGDPNGLPGAGFRALGDMFARNVNMSDLAGVLQTTVLDRPVVDQSGLTGRWDFALLWAPDEFQFAGLGVRRTGPAPPSDRDNLFTAMQQQLGLKLEATKAAVDVLVLDKLEKPSEN